MKLPKPIKRGDAWRICVNFNNKRYTSTHDTEQEAKEWSARKILELKDQKKRSDSGERERILFSFAIKTYLEVSAIKKASYKKEGLFLNKLVRENPEFQDIYLDEIKKPQIVLWREKRLRQVAPGSVIREFNILSAFFSFCIDEMEWLEISPTYKVKRPQEPESRVRSIDQWEIDLMLEKTGYTLGARPEMPRHKMIWAWLFCIESAMRAGEIVNLTWDRVDYKNRLIRLPRSKGNPARSVPIFEQMHEMLEQVKGLDEQRVLPTTSASVDTLFRKYRDKTIIEDLHFHDSRHEAITRLAQLMPVQDLQKVTGHTDINTLVRVYYNPKAHEIADRVNKARNV